MTTQASSEAPAQPLPRSLFILGLALLHITGCATRGPEAMRASRLDYNAAVQVSDQRELLLNLVRLRYLEAPEFLAIGGISTQMRVDAQVALGGEVGETGPNDIRLLFPNASIGYSEFPTITFVPSRDQDFTRQLVTPLELDNIYLLTRYGWGLDRVLRLAVSRLNDLDNFVSREAISTSIENLAAFKNVVSRVQQLRAAELLDIDAQSRREIFLDSVPESEVLAREVLNAINAGYRLERRSDNAGFALVGQRLHYVLNVDEAAWQQSNMDSLRAALSLTQQRSSYDLDPASAASDDTNVLRIETRSILGVMAYLSHAVSVPDEHTSSVAPDTGMTELLGDLLRISVSAEPVDGAFAAVQFRGYWYYVDDRDLQSKRTLGLLTSLVRLNIAAGGAQNLPILTLPVSP